jgi:hypothetical protein
VNYLHKEKHDYMTHFFCKKEKKRSIREHHRGRELEEEEASS